MSQSQSQAQFSISISDAQQDPFREFFKPEDSQSYSYCSSEMPSEIPDSQDSQDSQDLQDWINTPATSRDDRIAIHTALKFKVSHARIREVLRVN